MMQRESNQVRNGPCFKLSVLEPQMVTVPIFRKEIDVDRWGFK